MIAPETIWIFSCHRGTPELVASSAVHRPSMANVGPRKENVPPWITGSLFPSGDC